MSICLPAAAIEAILPVLTLGMSLDSTSKQAADINPQVMRSFEEVTLECRALLGKTSLSVHEITNLEAGDVIRLPVKADGHTELWVGNVPAFRGTLGRSGRTLAIKISDSLRAPESA
jgi:flagellar motor switch protein FliM